MCHYLLMALAAGSDGWARGQMMRLLGGRRWGFLGVCVLLLVAVAVLEQPSTSIAANRPWPTNGWSNPVSDPNYEDWGFASCNPPYDIPYAHLGTDSQGSAPAGSAVKAMAAGRVVKITASGWPGGAVGIAHSGQAGEFVAVYGHVDVSVAVGNPVVAGQTIGTLHDWANSSNEHLHLGIWPVPANQIADNVVLHGRGECVNGSVNTRGYVDPIPYLNGNPPGANSNPFGSLDVADSPGPGRLHVRGWAADPSAPTQSLAVHVYSGATFLCSLPANKTRDDVATAYPGYGSAHGFDDVIEVPAGGSLTVCAFGIDVGVGGNTQLPICRPVNVAPAPPPVAPPPPTSPPVTPPSPGPTLPSSGSGIVSLTPARLADTRGSGVKVGSVDGSAAAFRVNVLNRGGLPGSGVGAVALNVTAANGEDPSIGGGYVTVYPCGTRPDASNLNFIAGQTIPNAVIAPVSASGDVCFYVYGKAHLIVDVSGYFPT